MRKRLAPSLPRLGYNGLPEKVVIDKSVANALALHNINVQLWLTGKMLNLIEVLQVKYLNNIVEQSHRKVKGKMHQCLGWKSNEGATATLAGVELWSMIKNGQLDNPDGYRLDGNRLARDAHHLSSSHTIVKKARSWRVFVVS
jgi:transposase-like protein